MRRRQFADIMRVVLKTPVFVGVSENSGRDSLPPSQQLVSVQEFRGPISFAGHRGFDHGTGRHFARVR
jgi:hypothetical protein